jgi:hypothetical protein
VSAWIPPENVDVEVVVEVIYPTVGEDVAPTPVAEDQKVRVFGEPPERVAAPPRHVPATLTQPPVTLIPLAKVEVAVVEAAYMVSA